MQLRIISVVLAVAAVGALGAAFLLGWRNDVDPWTVAVLLVLSVVAAQRVAVFGDETAISTSIVILVAAAATSAAGGPLWVPAACAVAAGLHWDHLRNGAVRRLVVNTSCMMLAVLTAAALGRGIVVAGGSTWLAVTLSAALTAVAYWIVNNSLVAVVLWAVDGGHLSRYVRELTGSETELLSFALLGFFAGYFALRDAGTWAMGLALVLLLLLCDRVVVQRLAAGSGVRMSAVAGAATVAAFATAFSLYAAAGDQFPAGAALPVLVALGAMGALALVHIRRAAAPIALALIGTTSMVMLHQNQAALGPLVVVCAASLPILFTQTQRGARRRLTCATVLGAASLVAATAVLPTAFVSSVVGAAIAGAVGGCAFLIGWHLGVLVQSLRGIGVDRSVVLDLIRSDLPRSVGAGVSGGLLGWIGLHFGLASMAGALVGVMLVISFVLCGRGRVVRPKREISDENVLDIVRSAVLDLPASRLPDL